MSTISTGTPMGAAPPGLPDGRDISREKSLLKYFRYTDQAALLGWVLVTTVPAEWAAPLRYLFVGYFVAGLLLFSRQTMVAYARGWPTLILPAMCIVSAIWAPSAPAAIRLGIFMALTGAIAVYAASRLSGRQIIAIYFLGETLGAVLSVMHPNIAGGNWTGVFGQKNFLAVHMFIMYATGFALLVDREVNGWLRLVTVPFIVIGAALIFLTHSATTLILLIGATGALLIHAFVWQPAARLPHARTLIVMLMTVLVLIAALALFGFMQIDATNSLLSALGKDSTLTGRTFLWDIAHRTMAEHPLTGVGAAGFWRPELGAANEITRFFFYENYVKFSFHNSYLENGVQFGYPGYYATYFVAGWGLWSCFRTWMKNQSLPNAAFLILAVMVLIRSNAEVDLAGELAATAILLFIGAIRKEEKPMPVRAPAMPTGAAVSHSYRPPPRWRR